MRRDRVIYSETSEHIIEISEGCLTIDTKKFPDSCISLDEMEAEEVLRVLKMWKDVQKSGQFKEL